MRYNLSYEQQQLKKEIMAANLIPTIKDLSKHERSSYSVARAISHLAGINDDPDCLEAEVSAALSRDLNRPTQGLLIPTRLNPEMQWQGRAGLDTKTDGAGKYTVATEVRDLIEILRNKTRVIQLGATLLSGLTNQIAFPVQSAASNGQWTGENTASDVPASDAAFQQKTMTGRCYTAWTSVSRKLLAQSTLDIERVVRNDLAEAHALAIDAAAIAGPGTLAPTGITGTTGVGRVYCAAGGAGGNGAVPTYSTVVDLETTVANANGDQDFGMAFLTTPSIRGILRKTALFANSNGVPVWLSEGGRQTCDGYPAAISKQVPSNLSQGTSNGVCSAILYGHWPSLIIGEWGVIEILVDQYSQKKQAMVEVLSYQVVDVLVRQPGSFAMALDATLT